MHVTYEQTKKYSNFNFSSTWIVLLISGQSEARRSQLNSNLLPTYPAGNLAKMENEAGIDTKKSLHRWGISVCADICCKIKIILIALKNGEVKLRSQWWEKEGRQVPPWQTTSSSVLVALLFPTTNPSVRFLTSFHLIWEDPYVDKENVIISRDKSMYIMDLGSLLTKKMREAISYCVLREKAAAKKG